MSNGVRVLLGNLVVGSQVEVEITDVAGQTVSLKLVVLQGRSVYQQYLKRTGETERVSQPLGNSSQA